MIRLIIIDDHAMVVEGIKSLLADSEGIAIVGTAGTVAAARASLAGCPADVALLDINLPDGSGIELCSFLKKSCPNLRVLGLSNFKDRSYVTKMIEQGASGYLLKNADKTELEEAIQMAHAGRMYLNMEVSGLLIASESNSSATPPVLTTREKEVLTLIAEGLTNAEIAEKLFISPLTVDSHRKNLLAKFEAKNTALLIKTAMTFGLL